jgi:hypothetical protein
MAVHPVLPEQQHTLVPEEMGEGQGVSGIPCLPSTLRATTLWSPGQETGADLFFVHRGHRRDQRDIMGT